MDYDISLPKLLLASKFVTKQSIVLYCIGECQWIYEANYLTEQNGKF